MSLAASVTDRPLDLPPPYDLVTLRDTGKAFEQACAIAGQQGAGTLVWVRRDDVAEFAVVLEPEEPLANARRAIYAGMNAMADALAVHAPPSRPISFDWPDAIRVDGVLVGGGRLAWPEGSPENETPQWLVFSAMIRTAAVDAGDPGLRPLLGSLDELGFAAAEPGDIVASFSRHLMTAFDEWSESGFNPTGRRWLDRFAPDVTRNIKFSGNGDLLVTGKNGSVTAGRHDLVKALASPSWLDPATGMPWL